MNIKLEYYFYQIETDKFIYDFNFKKLYNLYQNTKSIDKYLGIAIIDDDNCTLESDILLEYQENERAKNE